MSNSLNIFKEIVSDVIYDTKESMIAISESMAEGMEFINGMRVRINPSPYELQKIADDLVAGNKSGQRNLKILLNSKTDKNFLQNVQIKQGDDFGSTPFAYIVLEKCPSQFISFFKKVTKSTHSQDLLQYNKLLNEAIKKEFVDVIDIWFDYFGTAFTDPLRLAIDNDYLETVELLIDGSSKINIKNSFSERGGFYYAASVGNDDIVKIFLDRCGFEPLTKVKKSSEFGCDYSSPLIAAMTSCVKDMADVKKNSRLLGYFAE